MISDFIENKEKLSKEVYEYLLNKVNKLKFYISTEKINEIFDFIYNKYFSKYDNMNLYVDSFDDPFANSLSDPFQLFSKETGDAIVTDINEKIDLLIEENNKKMEERRSKETIRQKLDRIEDYLIELKSILKEKE